MKKIKEIVKILAKKKKAVFILVCCIVLLAVAVVQSATNDAPTIEDKDSIVNGDASGNEDNISAGGTVDTNTDSQETVVPVGVEPVSNTDEYFAKLRIENSDMPSEDRITCEEITTSILTRGYEDAFVCVNENNEMEITILCISLTEDEVAAIASNAVSVSGIDYNSITIKGICGV